MDFQYVGRATVFCSRVTNSQSHGSCLASFDVRFLFVSNDRTKMLNETLERLVSYHFVSYKQVGSLRLPPAVCDSNIFHYITAYTYIHNMHAVQALIVNRAV